MSWADLLVCGSLIFEKHRLIGGSPKVQTQPQIDLAEIWYVGALWIHTGLEMVEIHLLRNPWWEWDGPQIFNLYNYAADCLISLKFGIKV